MATKDAGAALLDIEAKMLEAIEIAWEEYVDIRGVPPSNLIALLEKTHKSIMGRMTKRIGFTFDANNLPAALIEVEKQREIILRMMKQREALS